MKCLKYILFSICFLNFVPVESQIIDTVQINDVVVYHIIDNSLGSQLFWKAENAEIISENPTYADSIVIRCNSEIGIITLSVYEKNLIGCIGKTYKSEILIEKPIILETDLNIPNVFTPNEDNINDYYIIKPIENLSDFSITIYNRWGKKVFETNNINTSWDGRSNGEYCSEGVYYYVIQYQKENETKLTNGFLHLFR